MNRATSLKWRQKAKRQAEARDKHMVRRQEMLRATGLTILLTLLALAVALLLRSAITDARNSVVDAIQQVGRTPGIVVPPSPDDRPQPPVVRPLDDVPSLEDSFALFILFSLVALAAFIAPRVFFHPDRSKDALDYYSKLASIISVVVAIVFGVIAVLQAWKQIALAAAAGAETGDVLVGVHPPRVAAPPRFVEVARVGPFVPQEPASAELPPTSQLVPLVCAARKKVRELGATSLIIVGRHDRQPYQRKRPPDSNAALAQRRADAVAKYLVEGTCESSALNLTVVTLLGGPRVSGLPIGSDPLDREVVIYAVSMDSPAISGVPR